MRDFPPEAPVNPGPVTPPSLPPLQGFLHIRVSNSVLYLLGGPGADSTLTTTLTPTELGPTQANPGTPHQGVHPRHAFIVRRALPAREFVLLTFCCAVDPRLASARPSATALLPHHATYIPVLYTRHVLPHIYTTTQIVHEAPLYARSRHTTARPLHTTHASCTQIHSLLCPMTTTQDAGVGGWSFAISRESCIPDVAALFRWPGVSPDPGPSPATGEKPGWAAATYNLPYLGYHVLLGNSPWR